MTNFNSAFCCCRLRLGFWNGILVHIQSSMVTPERCSQVSQHWQPCSRTIKDIVERRKQWWISHYDFFSKKCSQVIADIETRIAHYLKLFLDSTVAKSSTNIFMFWIGIFLNRIWIIITINKIITDIETKMAHYWLWGSDFRCSRRGSQGLIKLKQGLDHRCKGCETRH